MANVFEEAGISLLNAGNTVRNLRYTEIKHGEDGYNLYRDQMTRKYWIGTDDQPRLVWLADPQKINEALASASFEKFTPNYVPPPDAQSARAAIRLIEDHATAESPEHRAAAIVESVNVTGVDSYVDSGFEMAGN